MDRRGFLKRQACGHPGRGPRTRFRGRARSCTCCAGWTSYPPADQILPSSSCPRLAGVGVEVQLETINANDLQRRASPQPSSRDLAADIIMTLHNLAHLTSRASSTSPTLPRAIAKTRGAFYAQAEQAVKDGKQYLAVPFGVNGLLIAYRKSWFKESRAETPPKNARRYRQLGDATQEEGPPDRPDARSHLRRRAGLELSDALELRRRRAPTPGQDQLDSKERSSRSNG